jgi:hypothetical protein
VSFDLRFAADPVDSARVDRQRALASWHDEWFRGQVRAGVDPSTPDDRPRPSDYNLHGPDLDASGDAQDLFHERAREIMGIAPAPDLV